ncbi:hypothetical protein NQD34_012461 [Periophthalmus magnuspinnatus]|nr:hypothetical protein NQD34_012461 [Periophthalmus magnuspinnatus]
MFKMSLVPLELQNGIWTRPHSPEQCFSSDAPTHKHLWHKCKIMLLSPYFLHSLLRPPCPWVFTVEGHLTYNSALLAQVPPVEKHCFNNVKVTVNMNYNFSCK